MNPNETPNGSHESDGQQQNTAYNPDMSTPPLTQLQVSELTTEANNALSQTTSSSMPQASATDQARKAKKVIVILAAIAAAILLVVLASSLKNATQFKRASDDAALKSDIGLIAGQLKTYRNTHGTYPSAPQFYDGTFKPVGLTHINSADAVNYQPTPKDCNAAASKCTGFSVEVKLDSGKMYALKG